MDNLTLHYFLTLLSCLFRALLRSNFGVNRCCCGGGGCCSSLVAATAAAFANALVTSLADLASAMVLFDDAAGGVSDLPAVAVSILTLSLISIVVVLSMSLSALSLGFRMADGGL